MSTARPGETHFEALLDPRPLTRREAREVERAGDRGLPARPVATFRFGLTAMLTLGVLGALGAGIAWAGQAFLVDEQVIGVSSGDTRPLAAAPRSVEVGIRFSTDSAVTVEAIQVYAARRDIGSVVRLWDAGGRMLGWGSQDGRAAGWQTVALRHSVELDPGTYVASATVPGAAPETAPDQARTPRAVRVTAVLTGRSGRTPTQAVRLAAAPVGVSLAGPAAGPADDAGAGAGAGQPTQPAKPVHAKPAKPAAPPKGKPGKHPAPPTPPGGSTTGCVTAPHTCGFPDGTNTGVPAGTALRVVPDEVGSGAGWHYDPRGVVVVDGQGAVLDGLAISAGVDVTATDVTVKNSRITVRGGGAGISVRHAANVTIVNNEIAGADAGPGRLAVGIQDVAGDTVNLQVMRNDLRRVGTAIEVEAGLVQGNFIHDLGSAPGEEIIGIASNGGGAAQLTIRGNTVLNAFDRTAAVRLFQGLGRQADRLIEGNLLAGGQYALVAGANPGAPGTSGIVVQSNRFARSFYAGGGALGPVTAFDAGGADNAWTGNVWDDDRTAVTPPITR